MEMLETGSPSAILWLIEEGHLPIQAKWLCKQHLQMGSFSSYQWSPDSGTL